MRCGILQEGMSSINEQLVLTTKSNQEEGGKDKFECTNQEEGNKTRLGVASVTLWSSIQFPAIDLEGV